MINRGRKPRLMSNSALRLRRLIQFFFETPTKETKLMCAINSKFTRSFRLNFYSSHGDKETFEDLLAERLIWMEQAFNESGGIRVHINEPLMSEEEWRMIHNALSIYQVHFGPAHHMRQTVQTLMDKVRDNYIRKPEPCVLTSPDQNSKPSSTR